MTHFKISNIELKWTLASRKRIQIDWTILISWFVFLIPYFKKQLSMKSTLLQFFFFLMLCSATGLNAQSNQYLHFDKVDDYVEVPNASGYIANSNQITFAGWFYHDALSYGQGLMSIRGGGSGTGEMYMIQLNNGVVECRLITTAGFHEVVAPAFSVVPQVWQHWAWEVRQPPGRSLLPISLSPLANACLEVLTSYSVAGLMKFLCGAKP